MTEIVIIGAGYAGMAATMAWLRGSNAATTFT
jgi:NADH dehydrogenase FAD-containing subunit